jgi:hypothetical protein
VTASVIGYSPWSLYGPCDCGAPAGQPCLTGSTGAARLVVHYSRRPVDDVTGAGFTPVLTRDERLLLARVHCWARQKPDGSYWPRWERSFYPGMWKRFVVDSRQETAEVWWGLANDSRLTVQVRDGRHGEELLHETVTPRSVRQAVDLLVAWGILPPEFGSAYAAGQRSARLELLLSVPQPVLPRGWAPDGGADQPLPDPALRQDGTP